MTVVDGALLVPLSEAPDLGFKRGKKSLIESGITPIRTTVVIPNAARKLGDEYKNTP